MRKLIGFLVVASLAAGSAVGLTAAFGHTIDREAVIVQTVR